MVEVCYMSVCMGVFGLIEWGVGFDRYDEGFGRGDDGLFVFKWLCVELIGVRYWYDFYRVFVF